LRRLSVEQADEDFLSETPASEISDFSVDNISPVFGFGHCRAAALEEDAVAAIPRVELQLCDSDGDVADEFWVEDQGVLKESSCPASLSLALVAMGDSSGKKAPEGPDEGDSIRQIRTIDQVRRELRSRSTRELKRLLERSGSGSFFGLLEKGELVDRLLSLADLRSRRKCSSAGGMEWVAVNAGLASGGVSSRGSSSLVFSSIRSSQPAVPAPMSRCRRHGR